MNEDDEKFLTVRQSYINDRFDLLKQYNNNIFILSSGAFGVSFAFIEQVVKTPKIEYAIFLIISWMLIIISIFLSLVTFLVSHQSYLIAIDIWDKMYKNKKNNTQKKIPENHLITVENVFRYVNVSVLFIGFVFLLIYIALNLIYL